MIRAKILFLIIGHLLTILGLLMTIPLVVDLFTQNSEWQVFATAEFLALFIGTSMAISCREEGIKDISIKEAFVLTNLSWVILVFFSSLPFYFSELDLSFTNSFFEAMSGLTTTGATVITNLEDAPKGILLWRAMLQWIGGIGIIVMALAILPFLRIGGMQLFRTESSDKNDKIIPRAKHLSMIIGGIYFCLTIICAILLYLAGMGSFDAILHAMTTVSTGGFSTKDSSIGFFDSYKIEVIIAVFMIISSIPFTIHIKLLKGNYNQLFKDHQVMFFISLLTSLVLITSIWLVKTKGIDFVGAFRMAFFNITAILTTGGFSSTDYSTWGGFALVLFFIIGVVGGCTGSTTGGIKIFRFQILYHIAKIQILKLVHPHGVYKIQYNKESLSDQVITSVLSFFILFCLSFCVISLLLSFSGLDFMTSFSAAASSIANLGPGLGDVIGPAGNYGEINSFSKWVLVLGMLIGRLEIFTIFVLLSRNFWKS